MRTVHSVDGVLARPGESVQAVKDRIDWGEEGPLIGRAKFIAERVTDPGFLKRWNSKSTTPDPELQKFFFAANALLNATTVALAKKDFELVRKHITLFNELGVPYKFNEATKHITLELRGRDLSWRYTPPEKS